MGAIVLDEPIPNLVGGHEGLVAIWLDDVQRFLWSVGHNGHPNETSRARLAIA